MDKGDLAMENFGERSIMVKIAATREPKIINVAQDTNNRYKKEPPPLIRARRKTGRPRTGE